jgi:CheY-like chemotaxis protein
LPVLLASSNAARINKLQQILTHAQMRPVSAQTGQAAMSILKQASQAGKPLKLAILDDDVQDMNGFDLAEQIVQDKTITAPTLFLLTGNGQRGDAGRCSRIGIAAYLAGPITPSILLKAIHAAFQTPHGTSRQPLLTRHLLRESEIQHVLVDG